MNPPDTLDPHETIARELPWLVNGTLPESAAAGIHAHLECCTSCMRDYQAQVRLYQAMHAEDSLAFAPEASFQKLLSRLEASEAAAGSAAMPAARTPASAVSREPHPVRPASRRIAVVRWLAAAVVIETLGLGAALWLLPRHASEVAAPYMTLTSPEPRYGSGARVRVVFRAGLTLDELGGLLREVHGRIVAGPTDANVYTLGFSDSASAAARPSLEARIATLRASGEVLFAEPALPGPAR